MFFTKCPFPLYWANSSQLFTFDLEKTNSNSCISNASSKKWVLKKRFLKASSQKRVVRSQKWVLESEFLKVRSWKRGLESEVLKASFWKWGLKSEVLKERSRKRGLTSEVSKASSWKSSKLLKLFDFSIGWGKKVFLTAFRKWCDFLVIFCPLCYPPFSP
jgi:hypothetical protein